MTGAESLVRTLIACGVDTCFANPGTSEMHFVGALDRVEEMRCVLALFEGVASGAADGYGRMAGKPASTLFHLGPGLGNAIANLHNARRANTPIVNIVGEHATWHRRYDPPLGSDIAGSAATQSCWVGTAESAGETAALAATAVAESQRAPGGISTLILPADSAWNEGGATLGPLPMPARKKVDDARVRQAARLLRQPGTALLLNGPMLVGAPLEICGRIAAATGAELLAPTQIPRMERGAGRVNVDRVPYVIESAQKRLEQVKTLVMVNATRPIAFFAYPGKKSTTTPEGCELFTLADPVEDGADAVARLVEALGCAKGKLNLEPLKLPEAPSGAITLPGIAAAIAACLPEHAIVVDESITSGRGLVPATRTSRPHDWITNTGGAIGFAMPVAIGAAVACPGRKVLCLEGDGSGMYTLQALWTMARERLDIVTVVFANRTYEILKGEYRNVGAGNPGRRALDLLEIGRPALDWVALAKAQGVEASRATTLDAFVQQLAVGFRERGPRVIELAMGG
ncbi:MAG: acetolactate synthase large subunit [Betaproteobacteria bacterium]|nr:acetolactate synthase large subunit [Betaproteobacteria bacterium]